MSKMSGDYSVVLTLKKTPVSGERFYVGWQDSKTGWSFQFEKKKLSVYCLKKGKIVAGSRQFAPIDTIPELTVKFKKAFVYFFIDRQYIMRIPRKKSDGDKWGMTSSLLDLVASQRIMAIRSNIVFTDDFMRDSSSPNRDWSGDTSLFQIGRAHVVSKANNPFWYCAESDSVAMSLTGRVDWSHYEVSTSVMSTDPDAVVGLVFSVSRQGEGMALLWGKFLELVQFKGKKRVAIKRVSASRKSGQWYRLTVSAGDSMIHAYLDGCEIFSVEQGCIGGQTGLFIEKGKAVYDDVSVFSLNTSAKKERQGYQPSRFFLSDRYMRKWAAFTFPDTKRPVKDDFFLTQPTDWIFSEGLWASQPRWICEMDYTFLGTVRQEKSLVWLKQRLSGDFRIDLFYATPMSHRRSPFYDYPLHAQAIVHGSGDGLDDGYRFVFGSWDVPSCIFKNGTLIASSKKLIEPRIRKDWMFWEKDIHHKWNHVTLASESGRVSMACDGREIVSVKDDAPLQDGLFGILAWHTGITLSRVRIEADRILPSVMPNARIYTQTFSASEYISGFQGLEMVLPTKNRQSPSLHDGVLAADMHSWHVDLNKGIPGWMEMIGSEGASITIQEDGDKYLRMVNDQFGGMTALFLWKGALPLTAKPILRFKYRIPFRVDLNLFFLCGSTWLEIRMADLKENIFKLSGTIDGFQHDGAWHELTIPFVNFVGQETGDIKYVVLGDPGFSSSYTGAYYDIKDIRIETEGTIQPPDSEGALPPRSVLSEGILVQEDYTSDSHYPVCWRNASFMPLDTENGNRALYVFPRNWKFLTKRRMCALDLYDQPLDLREYPLLSFKCRSPKVHFVLKIVFQKERRVIGSFTISSPEEWNTVSINLLQGFQKRFPNQIPIVSHIILDSGNHSYWMDDLKISKK